jgi:hypothetical protein
MIIRKTNGARAGARSNPPNNETESVARPRPSNQPVDDAAVSAAKRKAEYAQREAERKPAEPAVKGRPGLPKNDQIVELGRAAWARRKQGADWEDWKAVGAALLVGRQEAMRKAQTNKPTGKAYTTAFSNWLQINQFDDLDKSDRAKLLSIMERLDEVEAYRASLSPAERMRWNHPNSVWRAFTCPDRGNRGKAVPAGAKAKGGEKPKPDSIEAHMARSYGRACSQSLPK